MTGLLQLNFITHNYFFSFSEQNQISIYNNGRGIPVTMHKDEKMYVPTMIFGHLLTSSNYDDNEKKVVGGRNGYGAKLCNIFSTKFKVETSSKEFKNSFSQVGFKTLENETFNLAIFFRFGVIT